MDINEKIRQKRKADGLTQAQLSKLLDIPLRTLQNWESVSDKRKPGRYAQRIIKEWLGEEE